MIQKPLSRRAIAPVSSTASPSITGAIAHRLICAFGAELDELSDGIMQMMQGALMIQKPLSRRAIAPVSSTASPSITGAIAHRLTKRCDANESTSFSL